MRTWIGGTVLIGALLFGTGCVKRVPVYDEGGRKITEEEIQRHRGHKNFWLYTLGGGAMSFGVSFFLGSLIDRSAGDHNSGALWATTGVGTALGTTLFAVSGGRRDRNAAIEAVKDERKARAAEELKAQQSKQSKIQSELEKEREALEKQEQERQRLMQELEKKKNEKPH